MPEREMWVCKMHHAIMVSEFAVKGGKRICSWHGTETLPNCKKCDGILINFASLEKEQERRIKEWDKRQRT